METNAVVIGLETIRFNTTIKCCRNGLETIPFKTTFFGKNYSNNFFWIILQREWMFPLK